MPEGLSPAEVSKEIAEHKERSAHEAETLESVSFNAWFSALSVGNKKAEALAQRRLRPGYRPAFNAWLATDPAHNPNSPPGR
jgi:hypothetical protein